MFIRFDYLFALSIRNDRHHRMVWASRQGSAAWRIEAGEQYGAPNGFLSAVCAARSRQLNANPLDGALLALLNSLIRCCTIDQDHLDPLQRVLYPLPRYTSVAEARLAHEQARQRLM